MVSNLTSNRYPHLQRDPKFTKIQEKHVVYFKELLGSDSAVIDGVTKDASEDIEAFNSDWMRKFRGHTKLVLKPSSTQEVSKILKYCNDHMLAVVPQGGNTGLVGGSVPVFDEIVINMQKMNEIRSFDEVSGILVADAGVILENADNFLAGKNHIFPLDLGAKGSCYIGGNVATNAGGLRLLRYGSFHGNVLGIEAVLPDGTIVDDLSTLRKNNTGYDLKQLFIGGEGTIGIITKVAIICPRRSPAVNVAYFGLESYEKVQQAFIEAKGHLSEILSAFELMDGRTQKLVNRVTGKSMPLEGEHPFYCLIETSGSNTDHDSEVSTTSGNIYELLLIQYRNSRLSLSMSWRAKSSQMASLLKIRPKFRSSGHGEKALLSAWAMMEVSTSTTCPFPSQNSTTWSTKLGIA